MADDEPPEQEANSEPAKPPYYDYSQQQADKHQAQARTDAQVADDLLHNPRYDDFFATQQAKFQPGFREKFVSDYVTRRYQWTRFGDFYERQLAGQLTQFEQAAYLRLWDIQQKKLFDLQCEWRAELVTVPGVCVSADFQTLSGSIENCAVLPPITPDELDLYIAWVQQADYELDLNHTWGDYSNWQNYDDVRQQLVSASDEQEDNFVFEEVSEWYAFHNLHTGNSQLLLLPDLRGQKEAHYLAACQAQQQAAQAEKEARQQASPTPAPEWRSSFSYYSHPELLVEFAQQFEPAMVNRQRSAYEEANPPETWEDEELERVIVFLKGVSEPVPIAAGADWQLALRQASYAFRQQKLLESLPRAYEAYCQRREWGISQPDRSDTKHHDVSGWYSQAILEGRKLLGEPEDFDF